MDGTPYPLTITAAEAAAAIRTALDVNRLAGVVVADGRGRARPGEMGTDFGFPLLTGSGKPTANTAATLGQHYFDLTATKPPYEHVCVGYTGGGFVWQELGAGTGTLFTFRGFFLTLADLRAAISDAVTGDYAGVGAAAPYTYYAYDASQADPWVSIGGLEGAAGVGVPPHGSIGQLLGKTGADDYDTGWVWTARPGYGAPLVTTAADFVGQIYTDALGGAYVCTGILDGEYAWQKLAKPPRVYVNRTVLSTDWTASGDYADYPYRAAIPLEGVRETDYVRVDFAAAQRESGNFSGDCASYDGGVYIYAASAPLSAITIPAIKVEEVISA